MPIQLSHQDMAELQNEGYSPKEIEDAVKDINKEELYGLGNVDLNAEYNRAMQSRFTGGNMQGSTFQYNPTDNLIKWQLELNDILERAEHILREDIVVFENNNTVWKPNPNPERNIFNDYGVHEIMRVLSMYINRNTILSDYEPDVICDKVFDFGLEISNLIFMKYELFGLDTLEKRKNYSILVREIVDIVNSAYNRALYGGERESLRTARQISQAENLSPQGININTGEPKKERGLLNPLRWIGGGRYK
jgi:hypothetical protein